MAQEQFSGSDSLFPDFQQIDSFLAPNLGQELTPLKVRYEEISDISPLKSRPELEKFTRSPEDSLQKCQEPDLNQRVDDILNNVDNFHEMLTKFE